MNSDSSSPYVCPWCCENYPTTHTLGYHQNSHLFQSYVQIPPHILPYVVHCPPPYEEHEEEGKDDEDDDEEEEEEFDINLRWDPTLAGADSGINVPPPDWMEYEEQHGEEDYDDSVDAEIEMTEEEDENCRDRLTPNLIGKVESKGKKDVVETGEAISVDATDVELILKTAPVDLDLKLGF